MTVRKVLADGSELCERRLAAILQGRGAGDEVTSCLYGVYS